VLAAKGRAIPSVFLAHVLGPLVVSAVAASRQDHLDEEAKDDCTELGSITMVLRCNCGVNLCARATAVSAFVSVFAGSR
jgi:hypothetical protein